MNGGRSQECRLASGLCDWVALDVTREDRPRWRRGITKRNAPFMSRPSVVGWRRLALSRNAPKTDGGGQEVCPCVISGRLPGRLFPASPAPEFPAGIAILTSRPWALAGHCLVLPCGHVFAGGAAVEGPDRSHPEAPRAACPDPFQASAGGARDHGEEWGGKGTGDAAGQTAVLRRVRRPVWRAGPRRP